MLEWDRSFDSVVVVPAAAGFTTGAVFKSTRGMRAALLAGAIGSAAATAYTLGNTYLYNIIIGKGGRF